MDRVQFLLERIAEREATWIESSRDEGEDAGIVTRMLAACDHDRRMVKEAGPHGHSRYVDDMLLVHHDHPDFQPEWHRLFAPQAMLANGAAAQTRTSGSE